MAWPGWKYSVIENNAASTWTARTLKIGFYLFSRSNYECQNISAHCLSSFQIQHSSAQVNFCFEAGFFKKILRFLKSWTPQKIMAIKVSSRIKRTVLSLQKSNMESQLKDQGLDGSMLKYRGFNNSNREKKKKRTSSSRTQHNGMKTNFWSCNSKILPFT